MKKMNRVAFIVVGSLITFSASTALSGARDHEEGFFLKLAVGGGPAGSDISDSGDSIDLSGAGVDTEIAIGGVIAPNLALHGTLWGWSISDPDAEVVDSVMGSASGTLKGDFTLSAFGGGITYYFMPVNIYVSGSVGIGLLTLDLEGASGDTDRGLALAASVGKEWFVSDRWGLGVAVGITFHSLPDPDVDANWSGISVPIRFSATFN